MNHPPSICLISVLAALACVSCGDDPLLVEKREKQKTEIARLRGELALLEEQLKAMPPDESKELAAAKKEAETQTADIADLEKQVAELTARKRSLEEEFAAYKAKYPLQ